MTPFWVALCGLSVAALLFAEARGSVLGKWSSKPLASLGFVGLSLASGATQSRYGLTVLAALGLGWVGDVLLIPRDPRIFRAGTVSFLLGHLAFTVAFIGLGINSAWVWGSVMPLGLSAVIAAGWLWSKVAGMRGSVMAYITVITAMVAAAAGAVGAGAPPVVLGGALAFYASDLCVARNRFVTPSFVNRAVGLPLYYGAQLVLAWSVSLRA